MQYVRTKRVLAAALPAVLLAVGLTTVPATADSPNFYISGPSDGGQLTGIESVVRLTDDTDCSYSTSLTWRIDGHEAYLSQESGDPEEYVFDSSKLTNGSHTSRLC